MFLGVSIFDLYVTIGNESPEVMILNQNNVCTKLHLQRNRQCNHPLIVFVNCDCIFKNTAQYRQVAPLNLE